MLRQFEAELVLPTGERVSPTMGSVLHGALMERLPADVAEFLHTERLRPYSQSVRYEKESGRTLWRIHTLTDELGQMFATLLGAEQHIFLRQKGYAVRVQDFRCVAETDDAAILSAGGRTARSGDHVLHDDGVQAGRAVCPPA